MSIRRTPTGGSNASRLRSAAEDLEAWAEHFRRCEFACRDFREVLADVAARPGCGIYCDPPWIGAGDGYLHTFTPQDHADLATLLEDVRTRGDRQHPFWARLDSSGSSRR